MTAFSEGGDMIAHGGLIRQGRNNFNSIRIAMALLVVWSHSFALYFGSEDREPISLLMNGLFNAGNLAVLVFFVVSGFLITQSFDRSRNPWSYLKKRIARIHPGYLVATSLFAFVFLPLYAGTTYSAGAIAKTLGLNLLLQGYFVNPEPFTSNLHPVLNASLWSIPYEFWCYLGVLGLGVCGFLTVGRRVTVLAAFVTVTLMHAWLEATGKKPGGYFIDYIIGWSYTWFVLLPCFLAGTLAYLYRTVLSRHWILLAAGLVALVGAAHLPLGTHGRMCLNAVLFPLVVAYATFYVAFAGSTLEAARYGDFSYGTYLYAFPIQQFLLATVKLSFPQYVACSMLLALTAGVLSWYAVERWFHRPAGPKSSAATLQPSSSAASVPQSSPEGCVVEAQGAT